MCYYVYLNVQFQGQRVNTNSTLFEELLILRSVMLSSLIKMQIPCEVLRCW